jgi:hypothetical protein
MSDIDRRKKNSIFSIYIAKRQRQKRETMIINMGEKNERKRRKN